MTLAPQTVLIIENDAATRRLYERALSADYAVLAASDEIDWAELMLRLPLTAVAVEPGPVEGRGWDLIKQLRDRPETRNVPIVLCTAQDDRSRDQEYGVAAHLVKPVLPADLLAAIHSVATDA
ncbi:MAG TPA: hypothetical protein PLC98_14530 [Anaerolineales bacterium]|nr:hypothetical protein [Anaerolineales bacterium]